MIELPFETLTGRTLSNIKLHIEDGDHNIILTDVQGNIFQSCHYQDCCESVYVEDICGDIDDLLHNPILTAEEVTNCNSHPPGVHKLNDQESFTWTFYKLSTIKGSVTIRWYGSSNGYYSERVSFGVSHIESLDLAIIALQYNPKNIKYIKNKSQDLINYCKLMNIPIK